MSNKIQAIRGMNDVLPDESPLWEFFEDTVREVFRRYGYRNIRTPIVERTELFVRGVGEVTDIVEKEMYSFTDAMNGDQLSLRPEGTAPAVRAAIEHNLLYNGPQRLWYSGPLFRHERPQKGRYRQYHTFGAEVLGLAGAEVDIELLVMARRVWQALGLDGVQLQINTIGSAEERREFRAQLIKYFESHPGALDDDAQRRLHTNPLRILDSKNPQMQALVNAAPRLLDTLGAESRANFEAVQAGLRAAGIPFTVNPRLVRGLDYYNLTVFEWVSDRLGAQSAICSGGRYDGLFEQLGGKPAPGCGFGIGVERTLLLLEESKIHARRAPDAYIAHHGNGAAQYAMQAAETMRDRGLAVVLDCSGAGFKSQMKKADGSGARYAVIIGADELAAQQVSVKPLRETVEQTRCTVAEAAAMMVNTMDSKKRLMMAVYDLEEQEQIDEIKAWWKQYGNLVILLATAAVLTVAGMRGWSYYQTRQGVEAGELYTQLLGAAGANDPKKVQDIAAVITDRYKRTGYAAFAALAAAKAAFDSGKSAGAKMQLQWVVDNARDAETRDIARLRLAAVLLDEKKYDEALKLVETPHVETFSALYADSKGDILVAQGKPQEARAAYQTALDKSESKSSYRALIQVKLDALGAAR